MPPHGVLVIDKPSGPTSHDIVAMARRALGERRIGHTGTLDPIATGVLPLACGQATRLVQFLTASDKAYTARIRFGLVTDSYDITGAEVHRTDARPDRAAVERALATLRDLREQRPPPFSAKKVGGRRAYALARRDEAVVLKPAPVRLEHVSLEAFTGDTATVGIVCSAGFYVRSFAHALGELTGTGACLEALRRTRSGEFDLTLAIPADLLEADPKRAAERIVPIDRLLPGLPSVVVTGEGRERVAHGRPLEPRHLASDLRGMARADTPRASGAIRVIDAGGHLIGMARPSPSGETLHPSVVLI